MNVVKNSGPASPLPFSTCVSYYKSTPLSAPSHSGVPAQCIVGVVVLYSTYQTSMGPERYVTAKFAFVFTFPMFSPSISLPNEMMFPHECESWWV